MAYKEIEKYKNLIKDDIKMTYFEALRKELKISQRTLGLQIGRKQRIISYIEKRYISPSFLDLYNLILFAKKFGYEINPLSLIIDHK